MFMLLGQFCHFGFFLSELEDYSCRFGYSLVKLFEVLQMVQAETEELFCSRSLGIVQKCSTGSMGRC